MKRLVATMLLASAAVSGAVADPCEERFVELLVKGNGDGLVQTQVTQEIVNGPVSKTIYRQAEPGHWMTEVIEPEDQPWVLTHADVMYTSSDKGESWTRLRDLDSAANAQGAEDAMRENAATVRNAVCSREEIDGIAYETVEADFDMLQNFKTENHHKYWVDADGFVARTVYAMKATGFESVTTQVIEPAPGLTLPAPE